MIHADDLIVRARGGERLSSTERRHALMVMIEREPSLSNDDLGKIFKVTEGQIRLDKKKIREDRAKLVREDDPGLVVGDIIAFCEQQRRDIERSKAKAATGSKVFLDHCVKAFELFERQVRLLQDIGLYPKHLGTLTKEEFVFRAHVNERTGGVSTSTAEFTVSKDGDIIDVEPNPTAVIPVMKRKS